MERGLEDSLGDEGYAAWLQYREIQRLKRDRKVLLEDEGGSQPEQKGENWVLVDRENAKGD